MKTCSVLLVDDCQDFLDSTEHFLALEPRLTIVGRAVNGQAAIESVRTKSVNLVLMDIAMPVMNGLEATRRIKAQPSAPQVYLMTCHDVPAYAAAAQAVGADGLIPKSTLAQELPTLLNPLLAALDAAG